ncbi:MAG: hypothetical protein ACOC4B_00720 [Bacteroidota bacterium]
METHIQFKQERDFGEIFNAIFAFIRQEYKQLGKMLLYHVLPFLLVMGVLTVITQRAYLKSISHSVYDQGYMGMLARMNIYTFLTAFWALLAHVVILSNVYSYITLYVNKGKGGFTLKEVWSMARSKFILAIGVTIVVGLIIAFGMVLCIIPGIYLGVHLSLVFIILFYENQGFSEAFSRCFDLVKNNFWNTLLILVVVYVVIYLISIVLSLPAIAFGVGTAITSVKTNYDMMKSSTGILILDAFTTIITYSLYTVSYVVIAFQYFNLVEKKEKPSLEQKIENINQ